MGATVSLTNPALEEPELIRLAASGAPDGIAGLYRRYAPKLLRTAQRLTGSFQEGEDVVHDVFLGLPEALRTFEGRGSFEGWLRRVCVRTALMSLRSARRRREVDLEDSGAQTPTSAPGDAWDIERALLALPDSLRSVVVLRQVEGYAHPEIGTLLGISAVASRVRFARAVKKLRQALEEKR